MPECIVVRCQNNACMRFQRVYSSLPSADAYMTCKFCQMRQPATAFIHPTTKETLRGYDASALGDKIKELTKLLSMHGRPGHPSTEKRGQSAIKDSSSANAKAFAAGVTGTPGNFAQVFVPDSCVVGDELQLKAGGRTLKVIVQAVDKD